MINFWDLFLLSDKIVPFFNGAIGQENGQGYFSFLSVFCIKAGESSHLSENYQKQESKKFLLYFLSVLLQFSISCCVICACLRLCCQPCCPKFLVMQCLSCYPIGKIKIDGRRGVHHKPCSLSENVAFAHVQLAFSSLFD